MPRVPVLQGLGDVGLARDVREGLGPPLAVEGLIHGPRLLSRSFSAVRKKKDLLQGRDPIKSPPYAATEPAPSRHMERPAECCSVPRLTWFAGSHCARPAPQLHAEDFRQRLDYTIASGNWQLKNVAKTKKDALQARKLWYNTTRLRPSGRSQAAYGLVAQLGERSVRIPMVAHRPVSFSP